MTRVFNFICAVSIWALTLFVFTSAVERNLLGSNFLLNVQDLLSYLMLILFSLGLSVTLAKGGHVTVDVLYRMFPKAIQRICKPIFHIVGVFVSLTIAAGGLALVLDSHFRGRISSSSFEIPLFIPQSLIVLGGLALAGQFLSDMFRTRYEAGGTEIGQNAFTPIEGSASADRSDSNKEDVTADEGRGYQG